MIIFAVQSEYFSSALLHAQTKITHAVTKELQKGSCLVCHRSMH